MTDSRNDSAEEILLAFAVEQEQDNATLDRYLQLYPNLSGELIDLSLDLRLQRATEEITAPADEAWVEASLQPSEPSRRFRHPPRWSTHSPTSRPRNW